MRRWASLFIFCGFLQTTGCGLSHFCELPPSVTGQPSNETVKVGDAAIFTVAATGYGALKYQWSRNGVALLGANQPSYIPPSLSASDSGSTFTVTVTDSVGSVVSNPATLSVSSSVSAYVRFVSPSGSDSNPGTIAQPYLTIQQCASSVPAGSTCEIRAGTYRETVSPNSGITITAYQFEPVTVDGSDPVTGWTPYQGSIYKATVNLSADDTNQLFVGAQMMTEARWPNGNDLFHVNWATARAGTDSGNIVDSNLPSGNWTGAKIHLWSGSDPFGNQTGQVTASNAGRIAINLGQTG